MNSGFSLLCPRTKWTKAKRTLAVGDIVMLKNEKKLGAAEYRLGKVLGVKQDEDGLVRTVELGIRRRRGGQREPKLKCQQGLDRITMAVQRLVVLQAVKEQWKDGFVKDGQ